MVGEASKNIASPLPFSQPLLGVYTRSTLGGALHAAYQPAAVWRGVPAARRGTRQSGKACKDVVERPRRRHGPRLQRQACPASARLQHRPASAAQAGAEPYKAAGAMWVQVPCRCQPKIEMSLFLQN
jgi:hypothetical protein